MDLFIRFIYSVITSLLMFYLLSRLVPKLKKETNVKHGITVLYLASIMTFADLTHIKVVLLMYFGLIVLMRWLYSVSSFVASMSVMFMYLITVISAMISSNITLLITGKIVDYRILFASANLSANLIFGLIVVLLLQYYKLIVELLRKYSASNIKIDLMMLLSNVALFSFVILYQRITFENMAKFTFEGVINSPTTKAYTSYFFLTYLFVTSMVLVLIVLVNRIFMVDKNLENYKFKAETDVMTGALSREAGLTHLKSEMSRATHFNYDLTIAYIDVNDLKVVNDKWGHKEGDRLIRVISEVIQSTLREFDVVARLGGDEFLVIFTRCNKQQAQRVWRRITDEFLRVNAKGDFMFKISASVGITQFDPSKHTSLLSFVHESDEEMYAQKKLVKASKL